MYQDFLPIIIFTVLAAVLIGVPLGLQYLLSPRKNKGGDKLTSYECGELPEGSAWVKFNIWAKGDLDWVKMNVRYGKGRYANLKTEGEKA